MALLNGPTHAGPRILCRPLLASPSLKPSLGHTILSPMLTSQYQSSLSQPVIFALQNPFHHSRSSHP
ncbi:hypothetical protein I79_015086 [Cricetulus griseus]|uniref:Uncharacterized protein n=1 Tax=Cricetulus griseus TaxID=10029 RepID=G3HVU4_CRIGR|nr:hypothetical protein I79_015086 [Cricetulus griseus]